MKPRGADRDSCADLQDDRNGNAFVRAFDGLRSEDERLTRIGIFHDRTFGNDDRTGEFVGRDRDARARARDQACAERANARRDRPRVRWPHRVRRFVR